MSAREEGASALALPELERRVANTIRFGTIAEVKLSKPPRVKVKSGEITTRWLPWAGGRAGPGKRRWDPPEIGEQVMMLSAGGDMRQALVIPGIYQSSFDAPSDNGDLDLTEYSDGTKISYDRAGHELVADLDNAKITANRSKIELSIDGVIVRIGDGKIQLIGDIEHTGAFASSGSSFTHNSKNVGSTHAHSGVQSGGSNTGAPT